MNAVFIVLICLATLGFTGCDGTEATHSADDSQRLVREEGSAEALETSAPETPASTSPAPPTDQPSAADAETKAMAEQLGMTADELIMKKQMMMDSGMTPEEIAKVLMMGGEPSSMFHDDAQSNTQPPEALHDLVFFRSDKDAELKLKEYIGRYKLVLVFTRGYSGGMVCPFCTVQTSQLATNYQKFVDRNARVMIIYPGSKQHLPDFVAAVTSSEREKADIAAVKWPVVLDPELKAVNLLDIAADLAQPSTFIVDEQGNVTFAYVGANRTDRPSVQAMLAQLDNLQ